MKSRSSISALTILWLTTFGCLANLAFAQQSIVNYDFSTGTGSSDAEANSTAAACAAVGFTDGSGRSTADGGNFFTRNAPTTFTVGTKYVGFTVTADTGYQLNLSTLTFKYGFQRGNTTTAHTTATISVRTSADGFASAVTGTYSTNPLGTTDAATTPETASFDLSGPAYQGLGSIEVRIYAVNGAANLQYINRYDNIALTGTVDLEFPDNDPPTLLSIGDDQGGGSIEANATVTYTLTFSEDIDAGTVDASDFANAGTSSINIGAITETSPGTFTVKVTPTTVGSLQFSIPTTATIEDIAGNLLDSDPALLDVETLMVTPDMTPPILVGTDIVDDKGGGSISTNTLVTYTVSFNEDINDATVDGGDFDNDGSSMIVIGAISETSPGVFSVQVTPTTPGTLRLRVPTSATISDPAGFSLDSDPAIIDDTTLVANSLPAALTVSLNQIGYQTDAPKRFTAVAAPDGTPFTVTTVAAPSTALFNGTITGNLGDFSSFQPTSPGPYVIHYYPTTAAAPGYSHPFLIQNDLIEKKLVVPCIQFMVDSRSGVGTHPSAYGGNPWRDGTYYSFEIPSLIYLHLNAPDTSRAVTGNLDYNADKTKALDPNYASSVFVSTGKDDSGFVADLQAYYNNYDPPLPGCPDALKAVHFGLGLTMERPNTKEVAGDPLPSQFHSQTREWFAWFLYAWPSLRGHLPDSFYAACRDFTFANWATSSGVLDYANLSDNKPSPLVIDPLWDPASYGGHDKHPFKGRHAPGHSILPNLLLWQVALREGRGDANIYLAAAQAQTQWIIANLDWSNPKTTKGHRMSEYKMMTGLVHFLRNHPNEAPAGLGAKIEEWADTMIARSDNLWDFRRYELTDTDGDGVVDWTLPKQTANWNEPGNLAGFPACALAAAWTLDHAPAKQQRLRELAQSAIDCLYGRNPLNTGSASRPQLGFPDQETSWTPTYSGAAGWLESCRGALASGPGSEHFPNNPGAAKRWQEGWVNFNAALNMGISYMLADRSTDREPLAATFPLEISEILAEPSGDPLAEFIELHNPTSAPVRLAGLTLAGDVTFSIPVGTADLAPGQRCLLVRDVAAFEATHGTGLPVVGAFTGDLNDHGAVLELGDVNGNTFLVINGASLPHFPGHSTTLGLGGWRLSAYQNGSPSASDSVTFTGDPSADGNNDGIPDLLNHAVAGIGNTFKTPQFDLSGPGVSVRVTRNLAADDTELTPQWSSSLQSWQNFAAPESEIPIGGGLIEWTFVLPESPNRLFVRLQATRTTDQ